MWCIPSRNRPEKCQALLNVMVERGMTGNGVVGIDADEPQMAAYEKLNLPLGWRLMIAYNGAGGAAEIFRVCFRQFPDEPWYGAIADDNAVQTDGFEQALVSAADSWGFANANDLWQARENVLQGRMHGAVVFGGQLLRALGYWAPDGFSHLYVDDVWETLGRSLGNWKTLMDVVTPHDHPWKNGGAMDETVAQANSLETNQHDKKAYENWRVNQAESDVLKVLRAQFPDRVFRMSPKTFNKKNGLWLYLWDGNENSFSRFFRALQEQGCSTQGAIVSLTGVPVPDSKWIPSNWLREIPENIGLAEWIGLIWSDSAPQRPNWDAAMLQDIKPWNVVTSSEATFGDWRSGVVMLGIEAVKALGGLDPLKIDDQKISTWQAAVRKAKSEFVRGDSQVPRQNPIAPLPSPGAEVETLSQALVSIMTAHGVKAIDPDYTGVRLQIATPSISGRPEFSYTMSVRATEQLCRDKGIYCEQRFDLYNADIGLSRAKIVSEFLNSSCTHLLMIDDDMGWDITAVHRLFYANKDFVAVAGPKKSYPLRFACSHVDDNGSPIPLQIEPDSACAEVSLVGMAFVLITKAVAQKMTEAYADLKYIGADSKPSWALFDSFVRNQFRYSEDFAFCQRWRDIGGKIYVCPDVRLKHVGGHVYEGSMSENAGKVA